MAWFKVDDSFYDHPKFLDVPNAAIGLWVKAGAWCGKHLTDGVIPASQVARFKGTKSQIDALLSVGIWVQCEGKNGAKAYRFHDWTEYQPTRKQVLKEREDGAERQRKSRLRKLSEQEQRQNVTRDSHVTPSRDSHECHKGVSQRPDPARPDPTRPDNGGKGSQPMFNVDTREAEKAGGENEDELSGALRRARQAGISDTAIETGQREFNRRRNPKGPGLLRALIDDAWQHEQTKNQAAEAARTRRATIDACPLCDHNGIAHTNRVSWRCHHNQHQFNEMSERANTQPTQKHAKTSHETPTPILAPTKWKRTPKNPQNQTA